MAPKEAGWSVSKPYEHLPNVIALEGDTEVAVIVPTEGEKYGPSEPCIEVTVEQGDGGPWSNCNHEKNLSRLIPIKTLAELLQAYGYTISKP
jgi:hypothetical protein